MSDRRPMELASCTGEISIDRSSRALAMTGCARLPSSSRSRSIHCLSSGLTDVRCRGRLGELRLGHQPEGNLDSFQLRIAASSTSLQSVVDSRLTILWRPELD